MNILIPLGGIGNRFQIDGYVQPKPLINILGKKMISWVIDNLNIQQNDNIIIVYNKDLNKWDFSSFINDKYDNIRLIELNINSRGAAETVLYGLNQLSKSELEKPFMLLDGDTFYLDDIITIFKNNNNNNMVFSFIDKQDKPLYSYIKTLDENIIDIQEKTKISNIANTGAYCFKYGYDIVNYCNKMMQLNIKQKGEYYTSGIIKLMLDDKYQFQYHLISDYGFYCLGTPQQVKIFSQNYGKYSKQKFNFNINTLLLVKNEITIPKKKNIDYLRYIYNLGHLITIECNNNTKTYIHNVMDALETFNIPYNDINFCKQDHDFYINDKAVNSNLDLDKYIGFYQTFIKGRDFNLVKENYLPTIIKRSNDNKLKGEIYWYLNIPKSITKLFPCMYRHDINGQEYEIEKISGITLSYLYVNESLTKEILISLLDTFEEIHNLKIPQKEFMKFGIDNNYIYSNYATKLIKRYETNKQYYSKFKDSQHIFNNILTKLQKYEENNEGQVSIIHGDPVFTNIILDEHNCFKLIDMRGVLGDIITIIGDKWYDYAKIYQSISGYDEIYLSRHINIKYKEEIKELFNKYIVNKYDEDKLNNIKLITKSMLFSLLPLHKNEKCNMYYELINYI
jgi:dTDP-glucose pyrophosphorylase/aminoglycoside phosphotransferase